jgi:hypothetical protein
MGLNLYHTLLFTGQFIITLSAAAQWLPVGTGGNAYSIETHNGGALRREPGRRHPAFHRSR